MKISERGLELIRHFEGFRANPYKCQAGVWTIGYGHTKGVTAETLPITATLAEGYLREDVQWAEKSVQRLVKKYTQPQFDALVSFVFNLGGGALQRSSLRARLNRGDVQGAAEEFLKWVWAGGAKRKGLVIRRKAEQALFLLKD